jgi:hypothetical protein
MFSQGALYPWAFLLTEQLFPIEEVNEVEGPYFKGELNV